VSPSNQLSGPPNSPPLPAPRSFTASDGYDLAYRLWEPTDTPRALVIALHGIQSHSGWYSYSSKRLADAGYAVAFLDRRGSGANQCSRGDAPHADRLINDVVQFVSHLERTGLGGLPRVLLAVSWGGKLAAATTAARPDLFAGLALLTPGLCSRIRANPAQRAALRLAHVAGAGTRDVPIPLEDPALFTDVPEYQDYIRTDPPTLRRVTVRFLAASLDLDRRVQQNPTAIRCPTVLMLAGRDRIVDNVATRRLVASFGSPVKTLVDCEHACHTLEFEPDRDRFIDDLIDWLARTTQRR
jgi:acylglycerol lipase